MKNYIYRNTLIGKKQLRQLLSWSFTNYDSMQACSLADELKYLGFKYASQAGISISIEDLKIPFVKNLVLEKANQEMINSEKIYLKGKITNVERFQKIIDTWSLTSESLKEQVIYYFTNYDPLNSLYIMAFSGARGNLSQVRQLVGMRGLMSDPSGQIMNLPIKKNFREGLTITDYLMSGYGARKGIVDTALKTANSGYLTRRLIDVGQDILIREKDCFTTHSFFFSIQFDNLIYRKILGRILSKTIINPKTKQIIIKSQSLITPELLETLKNHDITEFYLRSPLTCRLYRAICQKCYGWDLANENIVDIGEAVGILAGQAIGEPGTQLTMRTFHTGGIFKSEARHQIISPVNGVIKFYRILKTLVLRTNRGEDVLITKNSGSIIIIPENKINSLIQIEIFKNTILFSKNNQYILKDTVIGELININKQIKREIKPILSDTCGEIFMPQLRKKMNLLNNNKLIWILAGYLYNSPKNSFINFYSDYKLKRHSFIFRTKLVNHYESSIEFVNNNSNLSQRSLRINHEEYSLINSSLSKLGQIYKSKNYLLNLKNFKYLVKIDQKDSKFYINLTRNYKIGILLTTNFKTLTGGTLYYDTRNTIKSNFINKTILYYKSKLFSKNLDSFIFYRTLIWLGEETHKVNCESNILLVEHGDFISKKFELIPGLFSKTSGIVNVYQKNGLTHTIIIKSGLVYEGKKFKNTVKKFYYPGEKIFSNIFVKTLAFCEQNNSKNLEQLLLRTVEIYELSNLLIDNISSHTELNTYSHFKFGSKTIYSYPSAQTIEGFQNVNLISNFLNLSFSKFFSQNNTIELVDNYKTNSVSIKVTEKYKFNHYILPNLKYKDIKSCFLIQSTQFIDCYTTFGYFEAMTLKSLDIVKFKVKNKSTKQIFLISNNNCFTLKKDHFPNKKLNDFIINGNNIIETGKIIILNKNFLILQKGRPYFFPSCVDNDLINQTNLQYKVILPSRFMTYKDITKKISLNYTNFGKLSIQKILNAKDFLKSSLILKSEFSKLFFKQNVKLYSLLMPQFLKKLAIDNSKKNLNRKPIIRPTELNEPIFGKLSRMLLLQSSETIQNFYKTTQKLKYQLALIKFVEQPFIKTTKSIGLYSITEDYFEQDANSIFCKTGEFIENGEIIGLLNLEKEITGDIVQGLPRIEEILEARKKNLIIKRIPTNQKKGLLLQKTSLDINFEFRKLGTPIKENEKINPHKLLKTYFNYYGFIKLFLCDRTKKIYYNRLVSNYEGNYKSFKKVQSFILNAVQAVYQSQGVTINNKHLEVIIKQMTAKVLITYEGNTPLLRREVIDLYHIQYINQIVQKQKKQPACYIPLLLGITKAALNNPSFISAASFQETTRVLTKAAIEGKIDWLRGLKENIIIGHVIPAGTGSQNYQNCFKKFRSPSSLTKLKLEDIASG